MRRVWLLLRALRLRLTWIAVGWAGAFGMALFGSKLHGLWEQWVTRQGISPERRQRMDGERFDLWDNDLRSKQ